jgi:hypothetical protein
VFAVVAIVNTDTEETVDIEHVRELNPFTKHTICVFTVAPLSVELGGIVNIVTACVPNRTCSCVETPAPFVSVMENDNVPLKTAPDRLITFAGIVELPDESVQGIARVPAVVYVKGDALMHV